MKTDIRPGPVAAVRMEPEAVVDARSALVTELFRAHYARLVGLARILADDEAPDVVQEAFVRLYASWHRVRDHERAGAYLRVSVLNVSRGVLRRRRRERLLVHDRPGVCEHVPADPAMLSAVRRLPARQRDCVLLRFYLDLSAHDIAATLGVSAGTVKNHLHRALSTLGTVMEEPL
jgi:RNA polymerase sigma-70 factor (ECF subfamily)